jgi:flagellar basal body rod protein FlgG
MNSQLYSAASGLVVERQRLDLIANNLANLSTPGFRAQRLFTIPFGRTEAGVRAVATPAGLSVAVAGMYNVPGPGPLRDTGRALDVALDDGTYLVVGTAAGRRYIRGGSLGVSADGTLIDDTGRSVLGTDNKPIKGLGTDAKLTGDGRVFEASEERGRLRVMRDASGVLQRVGNNLLSAQGRDAALQNVDDAQLRPGWLEGSGTDALGELVRLIESQRAFESYQKLVSLTMNEVNRRAVNELAG